MRSIQLLAIINRTGGWMRTREITDFLYTHCGVDMHPSSAHRHLTRLVDKRQLRSKWARPEPVPGGGRKRLWSTTALGRKRIQQLVPEIERLYWLVEE